MRSPRAAAASLCPFRLAGAAAALARSPRCAPCGAHRLPGCGVLRGGGGDRGLLELYPLLRGCRAHFGVTPAGSTWE